MKDSIFQVSCPCCGAKLEIDGEAGVLLGHEPPKSKHAPKNLGEAVRRLKKQESERESLFDQKLADHQNRDDDLGKKFAGLLKKQKGKKPTRPDFRDIDLD